MLGSSTVSEAAARSWWSLLRVLHTLCLPLLHCGTVEHVPHARRLLLEELAVLSALLGPGWVERRGVLVHQMGVLGASRPTEVLDLMCTDIKTRTNVWSALVFGPKLPVVLSGSQREASSWPAWLWVRWSCWSDPPELVSWSLSCTRHPPRPVTKNHV